MKGPTMAPASERVRSEPVNVTDYEATTNLQGRVFAVELITHDEGSTACAHVKWRTLSVQHVSSEDSDLTCMRAHERARTKSY